MPLERREDIESYFEMYLEETTDLKIILGRKDFIARGPRANAFLVLPYSTRFNDEDKFKANLAKYHGIWNEATKKNRRAIHLVLTTDPKRFNNLWEANRHFSEAFNRFMSYLMKKLKLNTRPPYLAVYEYTAGSWLCKKCHTKLDKKFFCSKCKEVMPKEKRERFGGLLHCHLVIFGRAYLLPKRTITREWEKCGQGSYNFIYSLKNQKGAWVYAKGRPKEATKNETAESHLVKYLQKAKTDKGALYWVFNKRYFTNSKKLAGAPLNGWVIEPSIPEWKFLGAFHDWDLPDVVVENAFYLAGNGG
ncbi:MAG TPA: hypothetical protein VMW25_04365 [Clostridia bacterium]|nr:hypothetical protein [Clostridia bacterium]